MTKISFSWIWTRYLAAAVSAVLTAASFPPYKLGWLAWIGLVPLFLAIKGTRRRNTYISAGIWSVVFMAGITDYYFLVRSPVFVLIIIGGMIVQTTVISESSLITRRFHNYGWLILPCVWTSVIFLITSVIGLFSSLPPDIPIPTLANTQWLYSSMLQMTSITGECGLHLLILLVNSGLAEAISIVPRRRLWTPLAISMPLLLLCVIWGAYQLSGTNIQHRPGIAIVPAGGNLAADFSPIEMTRDFVNEVDRNREMPDGSIRPETGIITWAEIPVGDINDENTVSLASDFAREMERYLIVNFYDIQSNGNYLNVAVTFGPDGRLLARNAKRAIPPVVEASTASNPDEPVQIVNTPWGSMTTLICYETFFPQLTRRTISRGVDYIIVPANPADEDTPRFTAYHLSQTMLRAAENHVAIALSYANGLSALIDSNGRPVMHEPLDPGTYMKSSVAMAGALPVGKGGTVYSKIGDTFAWIVLGICFILITAHEIQRRRRHVDD